MQSKETSSVSSRVRFWGIVTSVKPRLNLTKFEGETTARCDGHLVRIQGTRQSESDARPVPGPYTLAIGPAAQVKRQIRTGDLLRGIAHTFPEGAVETQADLYKLGETRLLARAGDPGAGPVPLADPPRTDTPMTAEEIENAPRRPLNAANLAEGGDCVPCPYGVVVSVVRLVDPRSYRDGKWSHIPACLGPEDCPHFRPYVLPA